MSQSLRDCEVCGSGHASELTRYTSSPWPVVACKDCGFVFLHHVPGYQALVEEFAFEKTWTKENQKRSKRKWAWLDQATRWRLKLGKLQDGSRQIQALGISGNALDVGCGGECRLPQGLTPYGVEISSALADVAQPKFAARGGSVVCAPAIDGMEKFENNFFRSILMRSYLEHEEQPRAVLESAFRKLTPGGVIFVRVPDFGSINRRVRGAKWCGFRFPDHVNYFTEGSLSSLARGIGYTYRRKNAFSLFDDNLTVELTKPAGASAQEA
jgi:SAM-dependent methyltransferase